MVICSKCDISSKIYFSYLAQVEIWFHLMSFWSNLVKALLYSFDASCLSDLLLYLFGGDVLVVLIIGLTSEEASHSFRDAPVCFACGVEDVILLLGTILVGEDSLVDLLYDWRTGDRLVQNHRFCLDHVWVDIVWGDRLWLLLVLWLKFDSHRIILWLNWVLSLPAIAIDLV